MPNAIAETILKQLGGNRFLAMTGAHSLTADGAKLIMKLKIGKAKAIVIILDPSDTYTMIAWAGRGGNLKVSESVSDVYADNLQAVFTKLTGLDTHL